MGDEHHQQQTLVFKMSEISAPQKSQYFVRALFMTYEELLKLQGGALFEGGVLTTEYEMGKD